MIEMFTELDLLAAEPVDRLRQEAQKLYERCLTEGKTNPLSLFLERQLAQNPPPLMLLNNVADDLQQRLLALRQYYFDVRENVIQAFLKNYHLDITTIAPSNQPESYHLLEADTLLASVRHTGIQLSDSENAILLRMVEASLKMCQQLYRDIELTHQLQNMLEDWLLAFQIDSDAIYLLQ